MKSAIFKVMVLVLLLITAVACSGSDEEEPTFGETGQAPVVITIGNLTDMTGPSANAMGMINKGLRDVAEYYNEQNLVPGVELRVVEYDGQYDPAKDKPGYEMLRRNGADVIFTAVASSVVTLKPHLESDDMVLFTVAATEEILEPSGYIFSVGAPFSEDLGYTLLKWVAENDPDFPADRPAKVGGTFWAEAYGSEILAGAQKYTMTHPDQYEWVQCDLPSFTFVWTTQIETLKDCDYVIPPIPMNQFVDQYTDAGYDTKFVGTHAHDAFLGMVESANLWVELDGMYFLRSSEWWTDEDSTMVNLMKKLLYENHPGNAEEIRRTGNGYLAGYNFYVMIELIREAVELAGPESFGPQAIFDAAESFSLKIDGVERESLSSGERNSINYLVMYELDAQRKDLFRVGPDWNPVVSVP